ncbi:DUF2188 domain-containing protein [Phenylobacterium sp.]|uniref:DUF2188 domain-containing protein n=1 Tax=Phenylobacterium sp. TaxID=1871053 RepID=UPI0025E3F32B|nr:DUF2188 domain-containing protein [Phenylobacterium sp.]
MQIIEVRPIGDGWAVKAEGVTADMVFAAGSAAELAARRLAQRLAVAGTPSELRIRLRDGSLAGRFLSPAIHETGDRRAAA